MSQTRYEKARESGLSDEQILGYLSDKPEAVKGFGLPKGMGNSIAGTPYSGQVKAGTVAEKGSIALKGERPLIDLGYIEDTTKKSDIALPTEGRATTITNGDFTKAIFQPHNFVHYDKAALSDDNLRALASIKERKDKYEFILTPVGTADKVPVGGDIYHIPAEKKVFMGAGLTGNLVDKRNIKYDSDGTAHIMNTKDIDVPLAVKGDQLPPSKTLPASFMSYSKTVSDAMYSTQVMDISPRYEAHKRADIADDIYMTTLHEKFGFVNKQMAKDLGIPTSVYQAYRSVVVDKSHEGDFDREFLRNALKNKELPIAPTWDSAFTGKLRRQSKYQSLLKMVKQMKMQIDENASFDEAVQGSVKRTDTEFSVTYKQMFARLAGEIPDYKTAMQKGLTPKEAIDLFNGFRNRPISENEAKIFGVPEHLSKYHNELIWNETDHTWGEQLEHKIGKYIEYGKDVAKDLWDMPRYSSVAGELLDSVYKVTGLESKSNKKGISIDRKKLTIVPTTQNAYNARNQYISIDVPKNGTWTEQDSVKFIVDFQRKIGASRNINWRDLHEAGVPGNIIDYLEYHKDLHEVITRSKYIEAPLAYPDIDPIEIGMLAWGSTFINKAITRGLLNSAARRDIKFMTKEQLLQTSNDLQLMKSLDVPDAFTGLAKKNTIHNVGNMYEQYDMLMYNAQRNGQLLKEATKTIVPNYNSSTVAKRLETAIMHIGNKLTKDKNEAYDFAYDLASKNKVDVTTFRESALRWIRGKDISDDAIAKEVMKSIGGAGNFQLKDATFSSMRNILHYADRQLSPVERKLLKTASRSGKELDKTKRDIAAFEEGLRYNNNFSVMINRFKGTNAITIAKQQVQDIKSFVGVKKELDRIGSIKPKELSKTDKLLKGYLTTITKRVEKGKKFVEVRNAYVPDLDAFGFKNLQGRAKANMRKLLADIKTPTQAADTLLRLKNTLASKKTIAEKELENYLSRYASSTGGNVSASVKSYAANKRNLNDLEIIHGKHNAAVKGVIGDTTKMTEGEVFDMRKVINEFAYGKGHLEKADKKEALAFQRLHLFTSKYMEKVAMKDGMPSKASVAFENAQNLAKFEYEVLGYHKKKGNHYAIEEFGKLFNKKYKKIEDVEEAIIDNNYKTRGVIDMLENRKMYSSDEAFLAGKETAKQLATRWVYRRIGIVPTSTNSIVAADQLDLAPMANRMQNITKTANDVAFLKKYVGVQGYRDIMSLSRAVSTVNNAKNFLPSALEHNLGAGTWNYIFNGNPVKSMDAFTTTVYTIPRALKSLYHYIGYKRNQLSRPLGSGVWNMTRNAPLTSVIYSGYLQHKSKDVALDAVEHALSVQGRKTALSTLSDKKAGTALKSLGDRLAGIKTDAVARDVMAAVEKQKSLYKELTDFWLLVDKKKKGVEVGTVEDVADEISGIGKLMLSRDIFNPTDGFKEVVRQIRGRELRDMPVSLVTEYNKELMASIKNSTYKKLIHNINKHNEHIDDLANTLASRVYKITGRKQPYLSPSHGKKVRKLAWVLYLGGTYLTIAGVKAWNRSMLEGVTEASRERDAIGAKLNAAGKKLGTKSSAYGTYYVDGKSPTRDANEVSGYRAYSRRKLELEEEDK